MTKKEILSAISDAYDFCEYRTCSDCPKTDSCECLFDDVPILAEIFELAVRCQKFNKSELD